MNSVPRIDRARTSRLETISGQPASLLNLPVGCAFQARCPQVKPACSKVPPFIADSQGFGAACILLEEGAH
jgi:peptide/nickel transport system ATP-binding protein